MRLPLLLTGLFLIVASPVVAIPTRNMQVMAHVDEYHTPVGVIPYAYSACWAYVHPDGREYAVIGTSGGTAIYNITNAKAPFRVGFILGPNSVWREMKQYRSWIYIVTEGTWGNTRGLQIVRMTDPDHPVLAATYTAPNYVAAHTVSVDTTRALLYLNGTRSQSPTNPDAFPFQGMQIFSLARPEAPVLLSTWPNAWPYMADTYVHDSVPIGNRVYAASIYAGTERVIDVSDPAHPVQTTSWTYPGAYYTHNSWPDMDGSTLYITDEQNGQTLRVFDIHDLQQPRLVTALSANPLAIVHNAVVQGHDLYLANYTEGVRVLDLTDPLHPAEFGWADTYPGPSGGYDGVWGVCPTLPSGTVIASDMQTGMWLFRVQRNYGRVRVQVVDAATQQPLAGVKVRATPLGDSLVTGGDGIVQFAPGFGIQQFRAERFGWTTDSRSVTVGTGGFQSLTLALDLKPVTSYAGEVRDATNQTAITDADVFLTRTPLATRTDAAGTYRLDAVPEDDYQVEIHRPGFIPQWLPRHIGLAFPGEDFSLTPAARWDSLESQGQWTAGAPGDNAYEGLWRLVAPVGTGTGPGAPAAGISRMRGPGPARLRLAADDGPDAEAARSILATRRAPERASTCGDVDRAAAGSAMCGAAAGASVASANGDDEPSGHCGCGSTCVCGVGLSSTPALQVKPWFDRTPGSGTRCFVTGQADSHAVDPDNADLDGGKTTLTSRAYDLSSATDPVFGYWRWFYSHSLTTGHPDDFDWLAVMVSNDNGASWTKVDTVRGEHNAWEEATIHLRNFVTPTATVKVRFVANDGGANTTVEAGIDDLTLYDAAATVGAPAPGSVRLQFAAPWPNPADGAVHFALTVPPTRDLTVTIVDLRGALVRRLHHGPANGPVALTWDGRDARGHRAAAGVYFAVGRAGAEVARARIIRLP